VVPAHFPELRSLHFSPQFVGVCQRSFIFQNNERLPDDNDVVELGEESVVG